MGKDAYYFSLNPFSTKYCFTSSILGGVNPLLFFTLLSFTLGALQDGS